MNEQSIVFPLEKLRPSTEQHSLSEKATPPDERRRLDSAETVSCDMEIPKDRPQLALEDGLPTVTNDGDIPLPEYNG